MKKILMFQFVVMLCMLMTGCVKAKTFDNSMSYYSNFIANRDDTVYNISGNTHIAKESRIRIVKLSSLKENELTVTGKLEHITGNVKILYITSDKEEIIIADSENASKDTLQIDEKVLIKQGEGKILFDGDDTSFKMELHIAGIDNDNYDYIKVPARSSEDSDEE